MQRSTYPIIVVVALASLLAAPKSFAQPGLGLRTPGSAPHGGTRAVLRSTVRPPHTNVRPSQTIARPARHAGAARRHTRLHTHSFAGHTFHGRLAWRHGRWHHATRNGLYGWWWDVGGFWYFYPEQIEGPPDYVSDIEAADEGSTATAPSPPREPSYAYYYRPGDFVGTRYQTLEECSQAREQAGNIGICIMK